MSLPEPERVPAMVLISFVPGQGASHRGGRSYRHGIGRPRLNMRDILHRPAKTPTGVLPCSPVGWALTRPTLEAVLVGNCLRRDRSVAVR